MRGGSQSRHCRVVPGEEMDDNPFTPSTAVPPAITQHLQNGPHVAWWRGLLAFPGSQVKRPKDKRPDSKDTAWAKSVAKSVCSAKGNRKAAHSQGKSKCAKRYQEMTASTYDKQATRDFSSTYDKQATRDSLPDPGISLFDIHKVILRGTELENEEKRKIEIQMQRRKRTDKVCEMQAIQMALRQKHDARLKKKVLCNKKEVSSNSSCKSAAQAGLSMNCVGYLDSVSEEQITETQGNGSARGKQELLLSRNDVQDDLKDGRASSMSAETDAEALTDVVQDTDDESYSLASVSSCYDLNEPCNM